MSNYQKLSEEDRKIILARINDIMLYSDRAYGVFLNTLKKEEEYCKDNHIPLSKFLFFSRN